MQLASEGVPRLEEIQTKLLQSQVDLEQQKDRFKSSVFSQYSHLETREQALNQFIPIFSPVKTAQLGVRRSTQLGTRVSALMAYDQRTANSDVININRGATAFVEFRLEVDLWKDLFGSLSRAQIDTLKLQNKKASIESEIEKKVFSLTLRRLYWSLVSNNESLKLLKKLEQQTKRHAEDAKKRFQSSVADRAELAGHQSQVATRRGDVLYLEFEREKILESLKKLVPRLQINDVRLADYDLNSTVQEVLACTDLIRKQQNVPHEFSLYHKIVKLLDEIEKQQQKVTDQYDATELSLTSAVRSTGVRNESNLSGTFKDMRDHDRSGFEIGVNLNIPLGRGKTKNVKKEFNRLKSSSQKGKIQADLLSTHEQLTKSIGLLRKVIKAQKENSKQMKVRVEQMQRKYRQARITFGELIQDQNAFLSSELAVINIKKEILLTVIDYLSVFTQTPCEFNTKVSL